MYMFCILAVMFSGPLLAAPHWTYEEQLGWGGIDDTSQLQAPMMYPYAECGIGSHQSPVDVSGHADGKPANPLKFKYETEAAPDFFNSGHAVQVNVSSKYMGHLYVGKEAYPLIQFHFHAPSEHIKGAKHFPAELHFVHIREDGKMAVLGILLDDQEDETNSEFQKVLDNVPATPSTHNQNTGIKIHPMLLLPEHKSDVFSYAGSLTTPPCSEGVNWYVLSEPVKVSRSQITQLENIYSENNRAPQDLNGRTVMFNKH
jgi:carbonic anhydrase